MRSLLFSSLNVECCLRVAFCRSSFRLVVVVVVPTSSSLLHRRRCYIVDSFTRRSCESKSRWKSVASPEMAKIIHAYWDIRGLGQPIRLLLEHVGADYEDKRYYTGPAPDYDKSDWLNDKFELGLDFPNLPYVIDGDVRLTQTHTIMRYLARKFNLVGRDDDEVLRCELAEQQLADVRAWLGRLSYAQAEAYEQLRPIAIDLMKTNLEAFSKFLGERSWMVGDRLTYVDFLCYETFFQLKVFDKSLFENAVNLIAYQRRFEELPKIAAYMSSEKFIKWPFNNNMARFGSREDECPF